jgi:hypothetical protein
MTDVKVTIWLGWKASVNVIEAAAEDVFFDRFADKVGSNREFLITHGRSPYLFD